MSKDNFDLYYHKEISPKLNEFERFRQATLANHKKIKLLLIAFIITYLSVIIIFCPHLFRDAYLSFSQPFYTSHRSYSYLLPITIISLAGIAFGFYSLKRSRNEFNYATKSELYRKIIAFYSGLEYQPFRGIQSNIVESSLLFPDFDSFHSEDYIQGSYKGVEIELSEIDLTQLVQKQRVINNREVIVEENIRIFRGLFLITSLNKHFSSTSYILPNRLLKIFNGLPNSFKRVVLEDLSFEKEFDVYSNDQIESRYLLTPSFMERLVALNKVRSLRCCFINNRLIIALEQNHDFLPHLNLDSPVDYAKVKQVIDELQILFDIIDTLKLDLDIGL